MTWLGNGTVDGDKSVKDNKPRINGSFKYIEDTMKNDHFWSPEGNSNLDGHHQFNQMPKYESGGNPADPAIATDMDLVYYSREKTSTEAPDLQTVEPFAKMNDGTNDQIMQLGCRAMVQFDGRSTNGSCTIKYSHNVSSVTRTAQGQYTINFSTDLPTENYIVQGSNMRGSTDAILATSVQGAASKSSSMTKSLVKVSFASTDAGGLRDPLVGMISVIGG